jgi:hypothetical protein
VMVLGPAGAPVRTEVVFIVVLSLSLIVDDVALDQPAVAAMGLGDGDLRRIGHGLTEPVVETDFADHRPVSRHERAFA